MKKIYKKDESTMKIGMNSGVDLVEEHQKEQ